MPQLIRFRPCTISTIPYVTVPHPNLASHQTHLSTIDRFLKHDAIVHIKLAFEDHNSNYIQSLVRGLHKTHGHGLPITHSANRGWTWDIRPTPASVQNCQARSETMEGFPWHTDCSYETHPPRFFALHVLQPDTCGGGTLSVLKVGHLLALLSPFAKKWLSAPHYRIAVPPEFEKCPEDEYVVGSLLARSADGKAAQLRFREDIITPLNPQAAEALEELKRVILGPVSNSHTLHLTAQDLSWGSIILMDNRRWLHARNQVKDPNRHLRRVRWDAKVFGTASVTI
ncbi:unnamed protein product [Penicillium egyptiacum]|uniref:TauD/TfdA-like domain-containing protein n=1 Tax=Penicillium egyptiacum TaxID=1303716 RepID=A0A9W4KJJ0_9EURO|nr:unnamed protein product [Penicillium egyptiacum]